MNTTLFVFLVYLFSQVCCQILVESKTTMQDNTTCTSQQHDCGDGICIELASVCDGTEDCGNGSDEKNCTDYAYGCQDGEFDCMDDVCILATQVCDQIFDCNDRSDEKNCSYSTSPPNSTVPTTASTTTTVPTTTTLKTTTEDYYYGECTDDQFKCLDDLCIMKSQVCDGFPDCEGDEDNCPITPSTPTCTADEFQCGDGTCIKESKICNGKNNCNDGSDEVNCTVISSTIISKMMTHAVTSQPRQDGGCTYEDQWYPAGSDIKPGNCSGILCTSDNKIINWTSDDPTCAACFSAKINSIFLFILALVVMLHNLR